MPVGADLSVVMLLIIAIVGTTVAPWQLFFQQSYLIDKRITPRFIRYERVDLWIGIVFVIVGAAAMMAFSAAAFAGTPGQGHYTDALGVADGLAAAAGHWAGVLFAIALIDASIIGAAAVGLSTSYALGDVLGLRHSLHRRPSEAKAFYAIFAGLLIISAVIVIIPGSPLGLLTEGVQTLAGVLLPSATVFLLLLCNDRGVLGPWVNSRGMNLFSGVVIAILVMLSTVLTASVLFPQISSAQIIAIFAGGTALTLLAGAYLAWAARHNKDKKTEADDRPPRPRPGPGHLADATTGPADQTHPQPRQAHRAVRPARLPAAGLGAGRGQGRPNRPRPLISPRGYPTSTKKSTMAHVSEPQPHSTGKTDGPCCFLRCTTAPHWTQQDKGSAGSATS